MKKILLLNALLAICIYTLGQSKESHSSDVSNEHSNMKHADISMPYRGDRIDNGETHANVQTQQTPMWQTPSMLNVMIGTTTIVGNTKYDLQTNNSTSNRLIWNNDGSLSACWIFSPDASQGIPPYAYRGTGYNYYNPTTQLWDYTFPIVPIARTEGPLNRTGFTNIVVTPSGAEMTIAHQAVTGTPFNRIVLNHRTTKGGLPSANPWIFSTPWGVTGDFSTWPKACGGLTNENVYVIWNGSGVPATTTSPPNIINGQEGPLYFSYSTNGGANWTTPTTISLIDSNYYHGFGGDCYSIDATGDTVAISVGDTYTDLILLKSYDKGQTWTKKIIWKHPIPFYAKIDTATLYMYNDTLVDTVQSHGGDAKVILDHSGMAHVVYSKFNYHDGIPNDEFYNPHFGTDALIYWNEAMGEDTSTSWDTLTYGHTPGVKIAEAEDLNGDSIITIPVGVPTGTCTNGLPWGTYETGITGMPSLGIDDIGNIYVTYQTINELADTTIYHMAYHHIYMKRIPIDGSVYLPSITAATPGLNIIPSINQGGNGEFEECVFGSMARRVDLLSKTAYVMYQADAIPGHSLSTVGSCQAVLNANQVNFIRVCAVDLISSGVEEIENNLEVYQNFPNPAREITYINVTLKKHAQLKVEVADILGKLIYTDSKGKVASGNYTFTVNTSAFSKGFYIYTVTAGSEKITRKMLIE